MECPRCRGRVEAYTLGRREAAICQECGWVGVTTSLSGEGDTEAPESWDEALDRVTDRQVSKDRDYRPMPPVVSEAETPDVADDPEKGDSSKEDPGLAEIGDIDETALNRLRAAEIHTVADLAHADPLDIATQTDMSEQAARAYIRKASIQIVTDDAGEE
jgi:hypothetical protein